MTFDFEAQKARTEAIWEELSLAHELPAEARVDLQFIPGTNADAVEFMGWLEDNGFEVEHYPPDEDADPDDEDNAETIEVQTATMPLNPDAIHAVERRCTEAALRFGWLPDGWGFMVE
ncbi:ribonuclease E inhibitor RraB [Jannaschia pohangensis]|uniref:Regulator of ribonuclease activity B n=1 Tax=Jannaschia pohangensis TaxID=390807 RepID=A0A1I3LRV1_9RHOB|nr:ribonuclease E inhibitor RraB [Jannaschia pohangensis]SFI87225.1 Regulator of ribonuclease activity B [Jannaschia pohangensis]